jgi:hypothetical protein
MSGVGLFPELFFGRNWAGHGTFWLWGRFWEIRISRCRVATDDVSTPKGATGTQVCSSTEITIQQKYKSNVRNIILTAHMWFV